MVLIYSPFILVLLACNEKPTISSIQISPEEALTNSTLNCSALATDANGDELTISYEWSREDGESLSVTNELILRPELYSPTETVLCTATASDGVETMSATTQVTIANTASTIDEISVTPSNPVTIGTELVCSAQATDSDGDSNITLEYNWHLNGEEVETGELLYLNSDQFTEDDVVACVVTATDSYDGVTTDYSEVVVGNSAPVELTNCGQGQVIIDGNNVSTVTADDSQYLKLTGTGDPDQMYGFFVTSPGSGRDVIRIKGDDVGVTDIEIEYFEIEGPAYSGITISNYPYCNPDLDRSVFTQANTLVHHNYIHDIRNEQGINGGEGMYIGTSHYFMDESPTSANCTTPNQGPSLRGV